MLDIRLMTPADISLGMRLKSQAGWNQTEADWRRFLSLSPQGCFVAEWGSLAVGTTVACVFGSVAWIAMVLVEEAVRGRGVGRALLHHALEFLDRRGVASVRLDATPLGQPLYEKLGFAAQFEVVRFAGDAPQDSPHGQGVTIVTPSPAEYSQLMKLDRTVTQTDRRPLLQRLLAECPGDARAAIVDGEIGGWLVIRSGSDAVQMGPCIADEVTGQALFADAGRRLVGRRVYLDVPGENGAAMAAAERLGLAEQRTFLRMCRGKEIVEDVGCLWASSGPELG